MSTKNQPKKQDKEKNVENVKKLSKTNGESVYEKLSKAMLLDKEKYENEKFKNCWPIAKEISDKVYQVWDDSMKIMQDYPSDYARTAAVCFFSFMCAALDAHIEMRFSKEIEEDKLPKIEPVKAESEFVKMLFKRSEADLNTEGQLLLKNLVERDFGYLMATLKAVNIENTALHNLLSSNFRFFVWEIMVPHLFLSEKQEEVAHA